MKITTPEGIFTLETIEDRDDDNIKMLHTLYDPQGKDTGLDWSPYADITEEDVKLWLALGRPVYAWGTMDRIVLKAFKRDRELRDIFNS